MFDTIAWVVTALSVLCTVGAVIAGRRLLQEDDARSEIEQAREDYARSLTEVQLALGRATMELRAPTDALRGAESRRQLQHAGHLWARYREQVYQVTADFGQASGELERLRAGGSGAPTGTAAGATGGAAGSLAAPQQPDDPNRTGAEREYSDPSSGPLIGEQRRGSAPGVGEPQEEVEQRIRTRIGEDPRTTDMPRVNVEVTDGVAELRGPAPSQEAREAAAEIAAGVEGVTEVRNLIVAPPKAK